MKSSISKKAISMALVATTALTLISLGTNLTLKSATADEVQTQPFSITQEVIDGVTTTRFNNISEMPVANSRSRMAQSNPLIEFAEEHPGFDLDLAYSSYNVVYQEEQVALLALDISHDPGFHPQPNDPIGGNTGVTDSWSKDDYLTIVTSAYQRGYDHGDPVYYIKANVNVHKDFYWKNEDHLSISTSSNGIYQNTTEDLSAVITYTANNVKKTKTAQVNYAAAGIDYKFHMPANASSITGGYYAIITGTTSARVTYTHNKSWLLQNVSVSVSYGLGVSYSGTKDIDPYIAQPINLYVD